MEKNIPHGWRIRIVLALLVIHGSVFSQSPTMAEADAFFKHQDYREAVAAYSLIVASDSGNALAWFRLGQSQVQLQRYSEAISAFSQGDKPGPLQAIVRFNLARTSVRQGNLEEAFVWLNKALDSGFAGLKQLETDAELSALRRDPRFLDVLERGDQNANPCEYDERFRQFDFWLGDWEVYNSVGTRVGSNHIEKAVQGCMLQENWVSVSGTTGQSTNYFDPASGKWMQVWVSQGGDHTYYEGDFIDGGMHFLGEDVSRDGTTRLNRMTIEPDPKNPVNVHQLIESSDDDGIHWAVTFDGIYVHPQPPSGQP